MKSILKIVYGILQWLVAASLTALIYSAAIIAIGFSRKLHFRLLRLWSEVLVKIFQIKVRLYDENQQSYGQGPYIFIMLNQTSLAQPFIEYAALPLPCCAVINIEFALIPIFGWAHLLNGGAIIVRQSKWLSRQALQGLVRRLRAKKVNIWISIEGQRSKNGRLCPYKKGPVVMALESKSTIIPVYTTGAENILAYGEWLVHPGVVTITLCKAIETKELSYNDRDEVIQQLRKIAEKRQTV
jgi:1-acyl-sn-glycerol-3-phosphate acyltransferase